MGTHQEQGGAHKPARSQPAAFPRGDYTRVPYWVFQDQGVHDAEQARIFQGRTWSFLCLEAEVPAVGDFKTIFLGDMPVIVVRSAPDRVSAFENRCAHRGSLLALKNSGHVKDFTCVYHAWRHDLEGNLCSVAFQRGVKGKGGMPKEFERSGFGPRKLRVATHKGLVFGTLDPDPPPLEAYLGPQIIARLDRVLRPPLVPLGSYTQVLPGNWKLYFENSKDSYHSSILHLFFTTFNVIRLSHGGGLLVDESGGHHVSYSTGAPEGKDEDYAQAALRSNQEGSYRLADPSILDRRNETDEPGSLQILSVFPNLVVHQIQNSLAARQIVPKSPSETHLVWTFFGYESDDPALRELRLKHANLVGPAGYVSMEDGAVAGFVQRGIKGSPNEASVIQMGGRDTQSQDFRTTEVSLRGFWKAYRNLMAFE